MDKPLERIVKEYPQRGPIRQYRFEKALAFTCIRCTQIKTAKLITIYNSDWSKRLCNGCYGRLLSIYEIKAGQSTIDDKVEALISVLGTYLDNEKIQEEQARILIKENRAAHLSELALKFICTSEVISKTLENEIKLDWSPAIIGLCKAFELEMVNRILNPFKLMVANRSYEDDCNDTDLGKVVKYCTGKTIRPPELGSISHFLKTIAHSKSRIERSQFLNDVFKEYLTVRPNSHWLMNSTGFIAGLDRVTREFRNKAAHTDELDRNDYDQCRELLLGKSGLVWDLVVCTTTKKK